MNLADRIAQAVADRLIAALDTPPEYDALYDRTYTKACAAGLDYNAAHAEASQVAEAWLAAQQVARQADAPGRE